MNFGRTFDHATRPIAGSAEDRRAAAQRDAQEREDLRQTRLAAQISPLNDPQERIRIWERLHDLRLPLAADHKLVRVIAVQTALTVRQVHEEQQRRVAEISTPRGLR